MKDFNISKFRSAFLLLTNDQRNNPLIYADNAATTQKPDCVIKAHTTYYQQLNANVHRSTYNLSLQSTNAFEQTREKVRALINAEFKDEIIWTKGCTESINLVAQAWGRDSLTVNDEILLSYAEHHANIVPWQQVAKQTGAILRVLPLTSAGIIDVEQLDEFISSRTRIVALAHISNVIGKINPIEQVIQKAKAVGAVTVIDGAQAIAHVSVDVQQLDCDFYAFSAHKMYGPTGVGVLYGKLALLKHMTPYQSGGEMISSVTFEQTCFQEPPYKFEAGTPNIAGVVAFGHALDFVQEHGLTKGLAYEQSLLDYTYNQLLAVKGLQMLVEEKPDIPLFTFTLAHHTQDVAAELDQKGIAVRVGRHCAMPLYQYLGVEGAIRISLAPYNTMAEVDYIISALHVLCSLEQPDLVEHNEQLSFPGYSASDDLIARFSGLKGWDTRHRELMLLGKTLKRLDKSSRDDVNLIKGCESAAWLTAQKDNEGRYHFLSDSDAKIIRGLLAVVMAAFDGKTAREIIAFDIEAYFYALGLMQHLSPSRANGLLAIKNKIIEIVS